MSLLSDVASHYEDLLLNESVDVDIIRDNESVSRETITIKAVPAVTDGERIDQDAYSVTALLKDWIVRASDYVFAGGAAEPQRRDLIVWSGKTFKIVDDGIQRQWDWAEPGERYYRIHTVRSK